MTEEQANYVVDKHDAVITQRNKKFPENKSVLINIISGLAIYSMFFPIVLGDIWTNIYQFIYFNLNDIPKVKRSEYVVMDRYKLAKLNTWQKFNCAYCEYANGVINWMQDVFGQTEIYSCAIKHWHPAKGQDHQKQFYSYRSFQ